MDILVTGASGFVGKNLIKYLANTQYQVYPLSLRNGYKHSIPKSTHAIIHLAGKAHDTKNTSSTEEYFQVNTELTKNLFDIFLKSDAKDFIYFSSVKASADSVEGILTEDNISSPNSPYGKSKHLAEQYMLAQPIPEGKRIFILRPCMIHGPNNKGNLNLLYKFVAKGIPYPLAVFENRRSFIGIYNVCFIVKGILDSNNIESGVYNIADDETLSTNDIVKIIAKSLSKKPRLLFISKPILKVAAKVGDFLHLPLNTERLKKLTENYQVSNKKIKLALKIKNLPVSAHDGLIKTIISFKDELVGNS